MVSRRERLMWQAPAMCRKCVWLCPWNGEGYGCVHPDVNDLLGGVVRCGGRLFKEASR